jgi:prevent-host-death family protein
MDGHEAMEDVTLATAKAHLSELIERAAKGEPVRITRRGKPVARLVGVERRPKPIDLDALRSLTASQPRQPEPARSWLRSARDGERY